MIRTKRLILRRLTAEDVTKKYVNWLNDPEVNQFLETKHSQQTLQSCLDFVQSTNQDPNNHLFGVFLKDTQEHIGNAKIGFVNTHYQTGQVSLFIGEKQYWGKGYSTELIQALSDYGFKQLGLHKLEAGCYENNLGSLNVFLRSGYSVEGFLRQHVIHNGKRLGCFQLGKLANE